MKQVQPVVVEVPSASDNQNEVKSSRKGCHAATDPELSSFQELEGSMSNTSGSRDMLDSCAAVGMMKPISENEVNKSDLDFSRLPLSRSEEFQSNFFNSRVEDNSGCFPGVFEETNTGKGSMEGCVKSESKLNETQYSASSFLPVLTHVVMEKQGMNDESRTSRISFSQNPLSSVSIPAPSLVREGPRVSPGKILIFPPYDEFQEQTFQALQTLKVIEKDAEPGDLCTRREYARWLVSASSILSRSSVSKVYPAMFIERVTELAFDDITPEDQDFSFIQGLAEAGLISSKLSRRDLLQDDRSPLYFFPESPLSRQNLVTWKLALEKQHLPVMDRKMLHKLSGFIDVDKIHPNACPALAADLSVGEHGIISLAFGYTKLFQPDKPVTKAQAAIALASGAAPDIIARIKAESEAKHAAAAHMALLDEVENETHQDFERRLLMEKDKIIAIEKQTERMGQELENLRWAREQEDLVILAEHAAIESELQSISILRGEVEQQLYVVVNNKLELKHARERIFELQEEVKNEKRVILMLRHELEVERKALSIAREWAEEEAKRAREQAKILEEARGRWERHGIRVVVDRDLREAAVAGVTWHDPEKMKQFSVEETIDSAEKWVEASMTVAAEVISSLREGVLKASAEAMRLTGSVVGSTAQELHHKILAFHSTLSKKANQVAGDCREVMHQISQKFKT